MDRQRSCFPFEKTAEDADGKGKDDIIMKPADAAEIRDELTGALIGLARATQGNTQPTERTYRLLIKGLLFTNPCVGLKAEALRELKDAVRAEKKRLVPRCWECKSPCGRNEDYDLKKLREADEDISSLKSLLLCGLRSVAACALQTAAPGCSDQAVNEFLAKALCAIGEDLSMEQLLPIALEAGKLSRIRG